MTVVVGETQEPFQRLMKVMGGSVIAAMEKNRVHQFALTVPFSALRVTTAPDLRMPVA